jgi:hypothetical protein
VIILDTPTSAFLSN